MLSLTIHYYNILITPTKVFNNYYINNGKSGLFPEKHGISNYMVSI